MLTLGSIVFSEIIPKAIGTRYAPAISRLAAPAIRSLQFILHPVVVGLGRILGILGVGVLLGFLIFGLILYLS